MFGVGDRVVVALPKNVKAYNESLRNNHFADGFSIMDDMLQYDGMETTISEVIKHSVSHISYHIDCDICGWFLDDFILKSVDDAYTLTDLSGIEGVAL